MTRNDQLIEHLEDYLDGYDGATPLPADVRDAIRAQLPLTRQRPAWWPAQRFPEMNNSIRMAMAAVAVVAMALVGVYLFRPPNVGGPAADPTASPSAASSPAALLQGAEGPGPFTTAPFDDTSIRFTFDLPAGWIAQDEWLVTPKDVAGEQADGSALLFLQVGGLYSDPCRGATGPPDVSVGSSADELVAALLAQTAYEVTRIDTPTDVGGYPVQRLDLVMPSDLDYTTCTGGNYWVWDGPPVSGTANRWSLWIIDVDGTPVVLLADYTAVTPLHHSQIERMVQSIAIQP